eukprot:UN32793
MKSKDFDGIFLVGGCGIMWDGPDSKDVQRLCKELWESKKIVSGVCHGPGAFVNVKLTDGSLMVDNRLITG